jgi:hypothetical protein
MLVEIGFCRESRTTRGFVGPEGRRAAADADRLSRQRCADVPRRKPCADRPVERRIAATGCKENLVEYGRLPSALDNRPLRFDSSSG